MSSEEPTVGEEVLVKALFGIDPRTAEDVFEGWHRPSVRWNGWATPRFDRATAERVVAWTDRLYAGADPDDVRTTFEWRGDTLLQHDDTDGETAIIVIDPDEDGRYPVGAFYWTWEELQIPQGRNVDAWLEYGHDLGQVYAAASNETNHRYRAQGVDFRFPLNRQAGELAIELFTAIRPEDPDEPLPVATQHLLAQPESPPGDHKDPPPGPAPAAGPTWRSLTAHQRSLLIKTTADRAVSLHFQPQHPATPQPDPAPDPQPDPAPDPQPEQHR